MRTVGIGVVGVGTNAGAFAAAVCSTMRREAGNITVPIVVLDQIYCFDRDAFIKAIPKPE